MENREDNGGRYNYNKVFSKKENYYLKLVYIV